MQLKVQCGPPFQQLPDLRAELVVGRADIGFVDVGDDIRYGPAHGPAEQEHGFLHPLGQTNELALRQVALGGLKVLVAQLSTVALGKEQILLREHPGLHISEV